MQSRASHKKCFSIGIYMAFIVSLNCFLLFPVLSYAKSKNARHIVVAFDISKSMWTHLSRRKRRKTLRRLHAVLAEMLFTSDRVLPSQGDDIPIKGKLPRPLLRKQDFLTLFLFGKDIQTPLFQHQKRSNLSQRVFLEKLPDSSKYWRSMKARYSLIDAARVKALSFLNEYPAEEHYFLLISDDVSDGGSKRGRLFRKFQDSKRQLELQRKKKRDIIQFSFRLAQHISIRVYQLKLNTPVTPKSVVLRRPPPARKVVIKVVVASQPKVGQEQVVQPVQIRSPNEWKKHKLAKATYSVSHNQKQLFSQPVNISGLQRWPYTVPISLPKQRLRGLRNVKIHMKLQFLSPEKKVVVKQTSFSIPINPKHFQCNNDKECAQKPLLQVCQKGKCVQKTKTAANSDSSDTIILIVFLLIIIAAVYYIWIIIIRPKDSDVSVLIRFEGSGRSQSETFILCSGEIIYLYAKLGEPFCLDVGAHEHTITWDSGVWTLQFPDGRTQNLEFYNPVSIPQGTIILEHPPERVENDEQF